ncbi:MAG: transposase [Planctomycetes bacterium]|nr:transposase [Planctomycetota bacterium]
MIASFFPDRYHLGTQEALGRTIGRWSAASSGTAAQKNHAPDPNFDRHTYRVRHIIERMVGWFKECRARGTRYDKLAVSSVALRTAVNVPHLPGKRPNRLKNI